MSRGAGRGESGAARFGDGREGGCMRSAEGALGFRDAQQQRLTSRPARGEGDDMFERRCWGSSEQAEEFGYRVVPRAGSLGRDCRRRACCVGTSAFQTSSRRVAHGPAGGPAKAGEASRSPGRGLPKLLTLCRNHS